MSQYDDESVKEHENIKSEGMDKKLKQTLITVYFFPINRQEQRFIMEGHPSEAESNTKSCESKSTKSCAPIFICTTSQTMKLYQMFTFMLCFKQVTTNYAST